MRFKTLIKNKIIEEKDAEAKKAEKDMRRANAMPKNHIKKGEYRE